ncbi:MAG: hypothetical protein L6Q71_10455 [Planctomycetes bacterium]|nr:hypothetical protein [Planctomycetota bacterium]NUQ34654.1 hypothetical protein [Planctomycetaceae bacterium]
MLNFREKTSVLLAALVVLVVIATATLLAYVVVTVPKPYVDDEAPLLHPRFGGIVVCVWSFYLLAALVPALIVCCWTAQRTMKKKVALWGVVSLAVWVTAVAVFFIIS